MTTPVSFDNRFFSATWSAIARREPQEIKELRAENLRGLTGHVLEVGAGIGSNFLLCEYRHRGDGAGARIAAASAGRGCRTGPRFR